MFSSLHHTDGGSETASESSDRGRDSPRPRRRGSPPPPRRMSQSGDSRLLSDTSSNPGSDIPRRSQSVRRPAPPPPQSPRQSRRPRSSVNVFTPSGPVPLDPAVVSALSKLAQDMSTFASSMTTEGLSRQGHGRQGSRRNDYVTMTNCVSLNGSNVDGLTVNNGGKNNSGAGASFFAGFFPWLILTVEPDV